MFIEKSFKLLRIAEDTIGIPQLIVEEDLSSKFNNIHLALLTYVLSMKQTLSDADAGLLKNWINIFIIISSRTDTRKRCSKVNI